MIVTSSRLFSEVKDYVKLRKELQAQLSGSPHNWPKFQQVFFLNLNKIYDDILMFEKENIARLESKVYRLKNIDEYFEVVHREIQSAKESIDGLRYNNEISLLIRDRDKARELIEYFEGIE